MATNSSHFLSLSTASNVLQSQIQMQKFQSNQILTVCKLILNQYQFDMMIDNRWTLTLFLLQEKYNQLLAQIPELRWILKNLKKKSWQIHFKQIISPGLWPNEGRTSCISSTCRATLPTQPSSWRCSTRKRDSYHAWMGRSIRNTPQRDFSNGPPQRWLRTEKFICLDDTISS